MAVIPQTDLIFSHWHIGKIPANKNGLQHAFTCAYAVDERIDPEHFYLTLRCRYRIYDGRNDIFSSLAEKQFDFFNHKESISFNLIFKIILATRIEFDIDFDVKKMGTEIEFASIDLGKSEELVDDVKTLVAKMIYIRSKM